MTVETKTRIVAAVLDTENLKLYQEDGKAIMIPQGDARVRNILSIATPGITKHGYVDLDLEQHGQENHFSEFEKQSAAAKFFKVAKSALSKFFSTTKEVVEPVSVGTVPAAPEEQEKRLNDAVAEIMLHATPVQDRSFNETGLLQQRPIVADNGTTPTVDPAVDEEAATHTMVAIMGKDIVPGIEKIKSQIVRAAKSESTKGMDAFLSRCASVVGSRRHSVDDLLRFLERADLPIAEDGSILIYKVLRKDKKGGFPYVDCHTRKVPQGVGSYVCMDESLVDNNRRNECSNGLHVARRGYIKGFSGDVCVMAKLSPEDVIAVPEYDGNKMRVCGYHIIFELTPKMHELLNSNRPITDLEEGKILLAKAIAGDHVGILNEVRITGHMGTNVVITHKDKPSQQPPAVKEESLPELAKVEALSDLKTEVKEAPVNPKDVVQDVIGISRKTTAQGMYDSYMRATDPAEKATALTQLCAYKKSCKVSWEKLGLSDPNKQTQQPQAAKKPNQKPVKKAIKKMMTPREEIQHLLPKFDSVDGTAKTQFAQDILKLKQQAKKSWDVLGVPEATVKQILLRAK